MIRVGLRALMEKIGGLVVVGEAEDGDGAIRLVEESSINVLLIDVEMPGPATSALIPRILRVSPSTAVVVVTMHSDQLLARRLREAGADDVLSKSVPTAELVERIELAHSGHSPELAKSSSGNSTLSPREVEVLHFVAQGFANQQIATVLGISSNTVKRHLANISSKLGAANRIDSVRIARAEGLLS